MGTPLPWARGLGPARRVGGPGGRWRRGSRVHAVGSCGRSAPGQVPRGQARPGGCKPQAKVEKGRSLPINPFYTVKTAGLSPRGHFLIWKHMEGGWEPKLAREHSFLFSSPRASPPPTFFFQQKALLLVQRKIELRAGLQGSPGHRERGGHAGTRCVPAPTPFASAHPLAASPRAEATCFRPVPSGVFVAGTGGQWAAFGCCYAFESASG